MGYAEAFLYKERIVVQTVKTPGVDDFDFMLAASKKVNGGRFSQRPRPSWSYPLSVDTCLALRRAFGESLRVHSALAEWYRRAAAEAQAQAALGVEDDAALAQVPSRFAQWLRPYQRVGAKWMAEGYRGAGLVADMPGLGKTPQTLAALLEAQVRGPVLVVCPKASVKSVWGREARTHLERVPVYLCQGTRERRERTLELFSKHMRKEPNRLRIVVVVAEMLRVELGNPCYTKELARNAFTGEEEMVPKNRVSGMCPQLRRNPQLLECTLHVQVPPPPGSGKAAVKKWLVPTGFMYPQLFNDQLLGGGWSWVVLDESHKLLGSLTVTKANLMGRALKLLPYRPNGRRYALTGTPFGEGGKLQGLFGTLHWLWPDEFTSYWKWAKDVFETEEEVVNRAGKKVLKVLGPKGLRADATAAEEEAAWEGFLRSLGPRVLRRTKAEMLKGLPPKTYVEVVCDLSPAQRKQYDQLVTYAEITTPKGPIIANGVLALRTRSQQLANGALTLGADGKAQFTQDSGKLDRLWEHLDARGILDRAPGPKLVIASRYNEFLDAISLMLAKEDTPSLRLDGSVSDQTRQRFMSLWQENRCVERVMLVNVKAGGVSINLDAADEMHMMDEDPDPGVNEQMEDRIHRASRDHKVVIYYYRTEGTVDYKAAHDVEYRRRLQHAVLDGRRGVEYMRGLITEALEVP